MKLPKWWPIVALVIAVVLWQGYGCFSRSQGELKQRIKAREQVIAVLAKDYGKDTIRFIGWKKKYDALRRQALAGDRSKNDSLVLTADSTISSCSVALSRCDSIRLNNDTLKLDLKKRRSSRFGCAGPVVASRRGVDLGVGCGFKF